MAYQVYVLMIYKLFASLSVSLFVRWADGQTHVSEANKVWHFKKGILSVNSEIISTSSRSRSLIDCSTTCAADSLIKSFYFDNRRSVCHCNTAIDPDVSSSKGGDFAYGQVVLSFSADNKADGSRTVTPTTPEETCSNIIESAPVMSISDGFPYGPYHALENYCPGYTPWMIFQRRQDGTVNFTRPWDDYVNGFGEASGEVWLGLEKLHRITNDHHCQLNITLEADPLKHPPLVHGYAYYERFGISGSDDNFRLSVSGLSAGNVDDSFAYHNGNQFSTVDRDNDNYTSHHCAIDHQAGWWYNGCHLVNLNGLYNDTNYGMGINWLSPWGHGYSLRKVEMMIRCLLG